MDESLDQFVESIKTDIERFADDYRKKHRENPEHYPLVMPANNSGLWLEFFTDFVCRQGGEESA